MYRKCFFFFSEKIHESNTIRRFSFFFLLVYTYERWFPRDKKKCSAFSHDIQRLVSDQARCKPSVFKLFIRIDTGQSLRTNASCDLARGERRGKKKEKKKKKKEKKSFPTTRDILEPYFVPCNSIYEFRCGACFNDSHDRLDLNYDMFKPLTQKFFLDLSVDYYRQND